MSTDPNQKEYQKAIAQYNEPNVQQIFISKISDKNNKPEMKIVIYQNGKLLSEKEAKETYDNIRQQLQQQQQCWDTWRQNIFYSQNSMWIDFFQEPFFIQPPCG